MCAYMFSTVTQQMDSTSYVKQTRIHNFKRLSCFYHVASCITQRQQKVFTNNVYYCELVIFNCTNNGIGFATQRLASKNIGFTGLLQNSSHILTYFLLLTSASSTTTNSFSISISFARSNSCIANSLTWP